MCSPRHATRKPATSCTPAWRNFAPARQFPVKPFQHAQAEFPLALHTDDLSLRQIPSRIVF